MNKFYIFFQKNLHISKKSCTFAPDFKIKKYINEFYILAIM